MKNKYETQYKWKKANKEKVKLYRKKWLDNLKNNDIEKYNTFKDKNCEYQKKYRKNNQEQIIESRKKWYNTNKAKMKLYFHNYRQTAQGKYNRYKWSAKQRNHTFNLTLEEFKKLIYGKCFYCGNEEKNGVDRIDSNVGYEVGNVVTCCGRCNCFKSTMKQENFIHMCCQVAKHLNRK